MQIEDVKRPYRYTKTYMAWKNMKARCYRRSYRDFKSYGGRWIIVCERWKSNFENFLSDMGGKPEGKSLDRINVDGNYEPSNCRWATLSEQNSNRRPRPRMYFKVNAGIGKAGFRGVQISKSGKFVAMAGSKTRIYLGTFERRMDAINARLDWEAGQAKVHDTSSVGSKYVRRLAEGQK